MVRRPGKNKQDKRVKRLLTAEEFDRTEIVKNFSKNREKRSAPLVKADKGT
jgi:uncharacterized protein YjaZ